MIFFNKKNVSIVFFLFISLMGSTHATCTFYAPNRNIDMSMGDVTVQRDTPVGSTIATFVQNFTATSDYANCNGTQVLEEVYTNGWVPDASNVAPTNIPGVGIKISETGWTFNFSKTQTFSGPFSPKNWNFTVQLIKTGAISTGVLPTGRYGGYRITSGSTSAFIWYLNVTRGATVTPLACSITTPTIQVPLVDVLGSTLNSVGTTANPKTFNLGLNCDAGAKVNVMMSGTQNTDTSTAGVLQLTNAGAASVAKGVGIQILYNNAPLALNSNIVLKTSTGGQETFPFVARYYQTKNPVSAGSANATATLNLTYQ